MDYRVNLAPPTERARTSTDVRLLAMVAVAVVVVFGLTSGYFLLNNQLKGKQRELADVERQIAAMEPQVADLRQYESLQPQKVRLEAVVSDIYAARTSVSGLMDDISLVVPDGVWFDSLKLTVADPVSGAEQSGSGDGGTKIVVAAKAHTVEDVAQMLTRLRLVPSLSGVRLVSVNDGSDGDAIQDVKSFTILGTVVDTSPSEKLPTNETEVAAP